MKKMNYTFIFVIFTEKWKNQLSSWVNIGYLVSSLNKINNLNVLVKGYDFFEINKAIDEVSRMKPDFVALSVLQENMQPCLQFIDGIKNKEITPNVILGNVEATNYSDYILKNYSNVNLIIYGEGEETIYDLTRRIINGKSLKDCYGIIFRNKDKIIKNKPRPVLNNLDIIDFPDRSFVSPSNTLFSIIGSRGCAGNCTFCDANYIYKMQSGSKVRLRSIRNIVDEVENLIVKNNCQYIVFVDPTFCIFGDKSEDRLDELYYELKRRDIWIQFYFNARAEQITEVFVRKLKLLEEVGFSGIQLGLEAGNSEDLKLYGKIASVDNNISAVKLLNNNNITFDSGFINFNPYTTIDKLRTNIEFFKSTGFLVKPHTLSTRLAVFSGAAITKQIMNDKLAKPYYIPGERYPYIFKDNKIQIVYDTLKMAYKYFDINDFQWVANLFLQYIHYSKMDCKFDVLVSKMNILDEFNKKYSQWSIEILEHILDYVENGYIDPNIIITKLQNRIGEIRQQLYSYEKIIKQIQMEVSKSLLKKNKLILYR